MRCFMTALAVLLASASPVWAQAPDGAALFRQQCGACHVIDPGTPGGRQGPHLRGVVGRKAGSIEGFKYSAGLAAADFAWDEEKLDSYLTNPQSVIRGGIMPYRQAKPEIRRTIIDYLKEQN